MLARQVVRASRRSPPSPRATAVFTLVVLVSPSTPTGTTITNTVNVSSVTPDPNLANNTASVSTLTAAEADLSVTKTVAPGPVLAGDPVTYTITVLNIGPSDAQTVALTDVVPTDTTFVSDAQMSGPAFNLTNPAVGGTGTISGTIGTLAFGASASFTVVVMVGLNTPDGTTITNTADVTAVTPDPNLANNSATVSSASGSPTGADLSVTKTAAAGPVAAGSTIAYTITVANTGPDAALHASFSDLVPANTTFISDTQTSGPAFTLAGPAVGGNGMIDGTIATFNTGATAVFAVVVLVSPSTPPGTTITNTANVTSDTPDPNLANNTATVTTLTSTEADVLVTKTAAAGPVLAGDTFAYTITVANLGPSDAQTVTAMDVLPANTTFVSESQISGPAFSAGSPGSTSVATIATLPAGETAVFTLIVLVSPSTPAGTTITNTASETSDTPDPDPANATASVSTLVATAADLSVTKTVAPGPVVAGEPVSYSITVSNAGPSDAQTVAFSDVVPADTTFVSDAQTSGPTFTLTNPAVGGTGTITGTIGTLALGTSATFTVVVLVSPSTPAGTNVTNTADVAAATPDPNLANNSSTVTTAVTTAADVSVTKTAAAGPTLAGNDITYTITVLNTGPSDAQTVALTDPLPADTTFVSDAQTSGPAFTMTSPAVGGTGTISGTIATLPLGDSASFTVVVLVSPSTPASTVTNTATVTSSTSINTASATNAVTPLTPAMPVVMDVQRFGFHDQATDLVVFFSTPLAAARLRT